MRSRVTTPGPSSEEAPAWLRAMELGWSTGLMFPNPQSVAFSGRGGRGPRPDRPREGRSGGEGARGSGHYSWSNVAFRSMTDGTFSLS